MTKSIMFVGTASNVGKSVLCTAMCRILHQDGLQVAPFKAQNMSLNSAVTPSGREIGRAQAVQAEACGLLPNEHMNPVLLKPTGGMRSQVVLQGKVYDTRSAREYFLDRKEDIWDAVVESYQFICNRYDVIVIEGAGSPVEMNLKPREIANMRTAELAEAAVILVADIDRGGIFASVVGTLQLLEPSERARVKGIVINKFRGDANLFEEGRKLLEEYASVPVLGVVPYVEDLGIDEEDSVGLDSVRYHAHKADSEYDSSYLRIAIVSLPHISNFTDFDPLFLEANIRAEFCVDPNEIADADVVILPGTKSTMGDLQWLWANGWGPMLDRARESGAWILGICGGYQMLGMRVYDPELQESDAYECKGLGILDAITTLRSEKRTVLVKGLLQGDYADIEVEGYEIHMGVTEHAAGHWPFARIRAWNETEFLLEGAVSSDGRTMGTYLHGILHNDSFRTMWLNRIRRNKGIAEQGMCVRVQDVREAAYDRLANVVRTHLDMASIYRMLDEPSGLNVARG